MLNMLSTYTTIDPYKVKTKHKAFVMTYTLAAQHLKQHFKLGMGICMAKATTLPLKCDVGEGYTLT